MTTNEQPQPKLVRAREPGPGENQGDPVATSEDIREINRKLAARRARWGGLRVHTAFFRCPWPCTRSQYEQYRKRAVEKWLAQMEKQGWDLKGKVAVDTAKRRPAHGYSGDWVAGALLDQVEIPVAAIFQKQKVRQVRFEVPVAG